MKFSSLKMIELKVHRVIGRTAAVTGGREFEFFEKEDVFSFERRQ